MFQFHFGSIGRSATEMLVAFQKMFQFHFGSIGRLQSQQKQLTQTGFNSTLVRLEGRKCHVISRIFIVSIPLWFDWKNNIFRNAKMGK